MSARRPSESEGPHLGESLYEFVSGRLPAGEARAFETHSRRCAACREAAASLRKTLKIAREGSAEAPSWLSARAFERVVAQSRYETALASQPRPAWWKRFVPQLAATSALAAAAVLAAVLLRPAFADALRWTAVRGTKTAATVAPPVVKAAGEGQRIGKGVVLAIGKAIEVTFGY